jgi:hypothetical protein
VAELTADRPGQHGRGAVGHEDARGTTRTQHPRERVGDRWRVVDHLEHGVAQHQIGAAGWDELGKRVRVSCRALTLSATPASAARRSSAARASGLGSTTVTVWPA